jgi:Sulfotransferase family
LSGHEVRIETALQLGGQVTQMNLWALSRTMVRANPVFIVGEARSGTSILYRTLQKHSAFAPKQQSLVETEMFAHLPRAFLFGPSYPESWLRFFLDDSQEFDRFLRSIRLAKVATAALAPVNYVRRDRWSWLFYAGLGPAVLRSFVFHATRARGCRRLVEKTPTNAQHLQKLTAAFPHARLLYVHRHPVDVYSSYRRRATVDPAGGWADLDVRTFAARWSASTAQVLSWLDSGRRNLLAIRYESFVEDPVATFKEICAFLAEPFEALAVEESRPDANRWPVDPHLWGAIAPRTKMWRAHISTDEAATVQYLTGSIMRRLGYRPYPTR